MRFQRRGSKHVIHGSQVVSLPLSIQLLNPTTKNEAQFSTPAAYVLCYRDEVHMYKLSLVRCIADYQFWHAACLRRVPILYRNVL